MYVQYLCAINYSTYCEVHCGDGVPFSCSLSIWDMYCLSWWKAGQQLIPAAAISPRKPDTGLDPVARDLVAGESILGQ